MRKQDHEHHPTYRLPHGDSEERGVNGDAQCGRCGQTPHPPRVGDLVRRPGRIDNRLCSGRGNTKAEGDQLGCVCVCVCVRARARAWWWWCRDARNRGIDIRSLGSLVFAQRAVVRQQPKPKRAPKIRKTSFATAKGEHRPAPKSDKGHPHRQCRQHTSTSMTPV